MLDQFFTSRPTITEHGPAWAQSRLPFLGKTFVGRRSHHPKTHTHTHTQTSSGTLTQTQAGYDSTHPTSTSSASASNPDPKPNRDPASPTSEDEKENDDDDASCDAYFSLLTQTLTFFPMENTFPPADAFVVDAGVDGGQGVVSVVGRAAFESVRTGQGWVGEFIGRLGGWDAEGRVGRWEIWADPLSAWVAVGLAVGEGGGGGRGGRCGFLKGGALGRVLGAWRCGVVACENGSGRWTAWATE